MALAVNKAAEVHHIAMDGIHLFNVHVIANQVNYIS